MIKPIKILFILMLSTMVAYADDIPKDASFIQLNTRTFDLRTDVRNLRRDDHFIPLTEIKWLEQIIHKDAYMDRTTIHIRVKPQPIFDHWPSLEPNKEYPLLENIPKTFVLDGYQTRSAHPSNRRLLLLPLDDPFDFKVVCLGAKIEERAFCGLSASYPPDPNIHLKARIYNAKPPFNFRKIAHRMREIAYCLDVTEQVKSGNDTPAKLVPIDGPYPRLRDCKQFTS